MTNARTKSRRPKQTPAELRTVLTARVTADRSNRSPL